jgi:hypothetical protein
MAAQVPQADQPTVVTVAQAAVALQAEPVAQVPHQDQQPVVQVAETITVTKP